MASPMPLQPQSGWSQNGQAMPHPNASSGEDSGVQVRPAGLKVLYKFNKEEKFDCLARPSQTFNVQTIPVDETTTIGIIDLRLCIQAVVDCSPELPGYHSDYTIYAHDYSEPDTPLVGQGMLSTALHSMQPDMGGQPPKMVTGLITKNKLGALMGNANKEVLEVKLKFTETPRVQPTLHPSQQQTHMQPQQQHPQPPSQPQPPQQQQPSQQPQQSQQHQNLHQQVHHHSYQQPHHQQQHHDHYQYHQHHQHQQQQPSHHLQQEGQPHEEPLVSSARPVDRSMTPTSTAEWSSFMQSNPQIGHPAPAVSRGVSPALSQAPSNMGRDRRESFAQPSHTQPLNPAEVSRIAPVPIVPAPDSNPPAPSSRPSSRASNRVPRKRGPTGRPRGRPRKKPVEGNTSGYEDGTEGEDGPIKKRVKTTQVDKVNTNPFGTEPESLRVAPSTAGSLRSFRPVGMSAEAIAGSHLQEIPRAPTPVPNGPFPGRPAGKTGPRQSILSRDSSTVQVSPQSQRMRALSPSQEDGRSPDSAVDLVGTPAFSDDSHAEMGSSPPVPRATSTVMQSSPPPSSPMLPPMPEQPVTQDDGLDKGDLDNLFGEEPAQPQPELEAPPAIPAAPEPVRKATRRGRASSTVPVKIFRMETDKVGSQDLVEVHRYNTPEPTSGPAGPASDAASRPYHRGPAAVTNPVAPRPVAGFHHPFYNTAMGPTPPQTTDAVEKPTSPPIDETVTPDEPQVDIHPLEQFTQMALARQAPAQPSNGSAVAPVQPTVESANDGTENSNAGLDVNAPQPPQSQAINEHQDKPEEKEKAKRPKITTIPTKPRKLARSQSAGALVLPTVPASEPAGPSSLANSMTAEHDQPMPALPQEFLRRAASSGPTDVPIPASDPVGPTASAMLGPMLVLPMCPPSEPMVTAPSSPQRERSNKNFMKKNAIKQKLEAAILRGEMPPYCSNCGAIQTPTWRKIYSQEHEGAMPYFEPGTFSTKPGMVTLLERIPPPPEGVSEGAPEAYRVTKKALAPDEDKSAWQEHLLCNPCGIFFGKSLTHRPSELWEGDAARLGQDRKFDKDKKRERKRRPADPNNPRPKRARTKSNPPMQLTSEINLPTDAAGPLEPSPPTAGPSTSGTAGAEHLAGQQEPEGGVPERTEFQPRSTHSNGSGTAKSPIQVEFDEAMGSTKRLLFPSPRKDDSPKILGELSVNIVHTSTECRQNKEASVEKENLAIPQSRADTDGDDLEDLFRSPVPPRPSTPTAKSKSDGPATPFKTPTRATPSHRPITRSVSRSMRSKDSLASPANIQGTPSRTPSKTPRGPSATGGSILRRSPRHNHAINFDDCIFDTPVSRAVNQMLSETNFGLDDEMDLVNLGTTSHGDADWAEFGNYFSTDAPMPSSPPKERLTYQDQSVVGGSWEQWGVEQLADVESASHS